MAAGISVASSAKSFHFHRYSFLLGSKPNTPNTPFLRFSPFTNPQSRVFPPKKNITSTTFVVADGRTIEGVAQIEEQNREESREQLISSSVDSTKSERPTYLIAVLMSSIGIISMTVFAVYCRYSWLVEGGHIPVTEILGTFASSVAAAVGMEFLSRWTHRALWHASLWHIHESHHRGREGPFELNDVFAIINAVPAIALLNFGFFHEGLVPGLCFGAGLGMTILGMTYIFVHNGLVHRRFPVGFIANVPYFHKVAAAHQIHHSHKFQGVPYGLFLGPKELEEVGGTEELQKEINRRSRTNGS